MLIKIFSMTTLLVLVMDPCGNLPVFVSLLKEKSQGEYYRIVFREALITLGILTVFLIFGDRILYLLHISELSLKLGGGVILFLISIKMIFGAPILYNEPDGKKRDLFIVPLAVPLFAGPSAIAVTIMLRSQDHFSLELSALFLAWAVSTGILLCGRLLARILGQHVLNALESLVGFMLALVSIEMFVSGLKNVLN